ncbi:MAG: ThiF family adenylyltransferase [Flavobacteriales bacterium]|jgi:molybdopterin/thiamine biosynthesis adenylyltransferase
MGSIDEVIAKCSDGTKSWKPVFINDDEVAGMAVKSLKDMGFTLKDLSEGLSQELIRNLEFVKELPEDYFVNGQKLFDFVPTLPPRFTFCVLPWKREIYKILQEDQFVFLRTVRNRYELDYEEQKRLSVCRVGIIGLSVGHSVAVPLALERICGELRMADFDSLELSNLNRLPFGLSQIGERKAINSARAIADLDPFLKVKIFEDGITEQNIEEFLFEGGKLDLVIDECDSGEVKLLTRVVCRKHGIPVLMELSNRGVLDVERFDLEPNRPLLHGMLEDYEYSSGFSDEEKRNLLMKVIDFEKVSPRGKLSLSEVGKSIRSWPQLGTDVLSGGAIVAMMAKNVLLGREVNSGRVYVDIQSRILKELG